MSFGRRIASRGRNPCGEILLPKGGHNAGHTVLGTKTMLHPRSDFDHSIILLVKLLCANLGISDVTSPKGRQVLDELGENRTRYTRAFRKVRRRIAKLANAKSKQVLDTSPWLSEADRQAKTRQLRPASSIIPMHVECYLVDVACMLVDGNLKRATMVRNWARLYDESVLRKHVKRTYMNENSKFQLDI